MNNGCVKVIILILVGIVININILIDVLIWWCILCKWFFVNVFVIKGIKFIVKLVFNDVGIIIILLVDIFSILKNIFCNCEGILIKDKVLLCVNWFIKLNNG